MNRVKKYLTHSTNIYETFSPFSRLLKALGLLSFTVGRSNIFVNEPLLTFFDGLSFGLWMTWYLFLFAVNSMWGQQEPEAETSLLVKHGWHKLYLFEMTVLACVVGLNFTKKLTIVECLRLIDQFDLIEVTSDYQSTVHPRLNFNAFHSCFLSDF